MTHSVNVLVHDELAGVLEETNTGQYIFTYNSSYLELQTRPVSLTLPLRLEPYFSDILFPESEAFIITSA